MARRLPATRPDRFVHPLSVVRAAHNWTYQDVVDIIARRHRNMAARREKAWKWPVAVKPWPTQWSMPPWTVEAS
jgi:hypothetical protein